MTGDIVEFLRGKEGVVEYGWPLLMVPWCVYGLTDATKLEVQLLWSSLSPEDLPLLAAVPPVNGTGHRDDSFEIACVLQYAAKLWLEHCDCLRSAPLAAKP